MAVDLGFRRLEHHAFLARIGRGDCARRYHPDRQALAAAGVDVTRGRQRQRRIAGMQRADVLVDEAVADSATYFPPRGLRRGPQYPPWISNANYAAAFRLLRFPA